MPCNTKDPIVTAPPEEIRLSSGSAAVLGLKKMKTCADTKTVYLMNSGGCEFDCSFCAQARNANSAQKMLSRVSWPKYKWNQALSALKDRSKNYKRVCMQVVNTKDIFDRIPNIVQKIRSKNPKTKIAMTIRTRRMSHVDAIFEAGADEVGLSVDAIDPEQFTKIKGGDFEGHKDFIIEAADKYSGRIATHIIIGMGETEQQAVDLMREFHQHQIIVALFAFTPVRGAKMGFRKSPNVSSYRRIQVALYLIRNNISVNFAFDEKGRIADFGVEEKELAEILKNSNVFETSGCSDCNRPYYNERVGSNDLYNYPFQLNQKQFEDVLKTIYIY